MNPKIKKNIFGSKSNHVPNTHPDATKAAVWPDPDPTASASICITLSRGTLVLAAILTAASTQSKFYLYVF